MIIYIPEPTDSVITSNKANKTTISINEEEVINIEQ